MLLNKKILVVVPARGGSKGIKLKNIVPINGVPLVSLVGKIVSKLDYTDRVIVSTDHPKIAEVAEGSGLDVPFYRPKELSGDFISDLEVLTHAITEVEKIDKTEYDVIVMLQPTCPLRKPKHVTDTVSKLIKGSYDAVWTVSETDSKYHPLKQLKFINNKLDYYDSQGLKIIARQQLEKVYHRNGAAYAIARECLLKKRSIKGKNTSAVVITEPLVNIDTKGDLRWAEYVSVNFFPGKEQ